MKQKIDTPEGYKIAAFDLNTGEVTFELLTPKYPRKITELSTKGWFLNVTGDICENKTDIKRSSGSLHNLPTEEHAVALKAFQQLVALCHEYNRIDGVVIDWTNGNQSKYCLKLVGKTVSTETNMSVSRPIAFGIKSTRDTFLHNFRDLLEEAKMFI